MARLIFPDEGSRLVYRIRNSSIASAKNSEATIYEDAEATTLADLRAYNGTETPGGVIAGSVLTTDAYSRLPLFWGPDEVDTVWAVVSGGPPTPVYARTDDRLDDLEAILGQVETLAAGIPTDGVTDATTAIRAAMTAAAGTAAAPGRLVFRRATYLISGSLDVPSYLDVDFNNATIKVADGTDKAVTAVRFMGVQRSGVRNLTIQANRANRTPGALPGSVADEYISGCGITTRTDAAKTYAADITIENVAIYDAPNHNVQIIGAERVRIANCLAVGAGDDNFSVGGKNASNVDLQPARMVTIVGCIARGALGAYSTNSNGFECDDGSHHVTITGCLAEDNFAGGYQIHSHPDSIEPHDITISGCIARDNPNHGFRVEGQGGAGLLRPYNIVLADNVVTGTPTYGAYLRRCTHTALRGNALRGLPVNLLDDLSHVQVQGNTCSNIDVNAGSNDIGDVSIVGNLVTGAAAQGIYLRGTVGGLRVRRAVVAANTIQTAAAEGVYVVYAEDVAVADNRVSGHGTRGVRVQNSTLVNVNGNQVRGVESTTTSNTESILVETSFYAGVVGNVIHGGRDGIRLSTTPDTLISGNFVRNVGNSCVNLVASGRTAVVGNRLIGAPRVIDGATSGDDVVIAANLISGASSHAIRSLTTCDHWLIDGNNYRGQAVSLNGSNNLLGTNKT